MYHCLRKIYLHLNDPKQPITFSISRLLDRVGVGQATHVLEFQTTQLYTRVWVNLKQITVRRDLHGVYLTDYRETELGDKVVCTREMRDSIYQVRPDISFVQWRPFEHDY